MDSRDGVVGILDSLRILECLARNLEELSETAAGRLSLVDNRCCVTMLGLLLQDTSSNAAHRSLQALYNIVQDAAASDKLPESIVPPLVALFDRADMRERATVVLANLVHDGPNRMATATATAIPTLVPLLGRVDAIGANAAHIFAGIAREHADAIVQSGALIPLVGFLDIQDLSARHEQCAMEALVVLELLSETSNARAEVIVATGALAHATKLLASNSIHIRRTAARLIGKLCADTRRAVAASGAIVPLVELCKCEQTMDDAARTLGVLTEHSASACVATLEAGGIAALVALDDEWALRNIAKNRGAGEVLDALVARRVMNCTSALKRLLRPVASEVVATALQASDRVELRRAVERGELVNLQTPSMTKARKLLETLDDARREQLEQCGLSGDPPAEFVCPITYATMTDPVVASDGHSYERTAIYQVIHMSNGKSPMTRATLTPTLVPNHALRQRIEAHESEQDAQAEKIMAQHRQLTAQLAACKKEAAALRSQIAQPDMPAARKRPRRGERSSA